jgi:hypothetical protein
VVQVVSIPQSLQGAVLSESERTKPEPHSMQVVARVQSLITLLSSLINQVSASTSKELTVSAKIS